jgi:hypothetical protein
MAVWGFATIILSLFKVDLKPKKMTLQGSLHLIAFMIVTQTLAITASLLVILLVWGFLGDLELKYWSDIPSILRPLHHFTGLIERFIFAY